MTDDEKIPAALRADTLLALHMTNRENPNK
jgi:hypothetical protein